MFAFSIGQKFNQQHWLKDALTKLQKLPVSTWIDNPTILSSMSPPDMIIALRLREHTHLSRFELICFRPEAVHTDGCHHSKECSFLWELASTLSVVPWTADTSYNPVDLYLFIQDPEVGGMGDGCSKMSREAALAKRRFYVHQQGVERAMELANLSQ